MKIHFANRQKDIQVTAIKKLVTSLIPQILVLEGVIRDDIEVSLYFVDEKEISEVHDTFFQDPTPTDCISFPLDDPKSADSIGPITLGEVFVCPKVAIEYSKKRGIDPEKETILYIVHGLLHLLGYDDTNDKARKKMRIKERKYMKLIASSCKKL